jgi:hypothetical protein
LLVAMTSDTNDAGAKRQVSQKWTLTVSGPPGLPDHVTPQELSGFRTECPHFGILTQSGGMVQQVTGKTVVNLGRGDIEAYVRLGAAIEATGKVTIRSGTFTPGIGRAFETRTEPNLPYATDKPILHPFNQDWQVFEVTADTLPALWAAMTPSDALRVEPFYGLAIVPDAFRDGIVAPSLELP